MTSHVRRWPLVLIAAPAAVAVWSGWVGLGGMCGFGVIHPLPGIWDALTINTAITLPVGVESYGAYALGAWLAPVQVTETARKFARRSAIGALVLGMAGQVAYHLLAAAHRTLAPWPVVVLVSVLPVITLGFGAALTHLLRVSVAPETADETVHGPAPEEAAVRTDGGTGVLGFVAPEGTDETEQDDQPEEPARKQEEPESVLVSVLSAPVPTDAERAAEIAMKAAVHVGNPFTVNQLSSRFKLTRAEATKVRDKVLAEMAPDEPADDDSVTAA